MLQGIKGCLQIETREEQQAKHKRTVGLNSEANLLVTLCWASIPVPTFHMTYLAWSPFCSLFTCLPPTYSSRLGLPICFFMRISLHSVSMSCTLLCISSRLCTYHCREFLSFTHHTTMVMVLYFYKINNNQLTLLWLGLVENSIVSIAGACSTHSQILKRLEMGLLLSTEYLEYLFIIYTGRPWFTICLSPHGSCWPPCEQTVGGFYPRLGCGALCWGWEPWGLGPVPLRLPHTVLSEVLLPPWMLQVG